MSKRVLTYDLATGKQKLETVIDSLDNAKGKDDVAYSAKAVDEKVDAIYRTAPYQYPVYGIFKTTSDAEGAAQDQKRYAISNMVYIYTSQKDAVGNPNEVGYKPAVAKSWKLVADIANGTKIMNLSDFQEYVYDSSLANKGYRETNWKKFLDDPSLVHTTGNESISGNKAFANNVTVGGDLIVNGTTTTINTRDLTVKDNIITLNDGDTGLEDGGISVGVAGIEINRGTAVPKAKFVYDEAIGTFKAGLNDHEKPVALIDDTIQESEKETYSVNKIKQLLDVINENVTSSKLITYGAEEDIAAGQFVYLSSEGKVSVASCANEACMNLIVGVAVKATSSGRSVPIAQFGRADNLVGLEAGKNYYLSTAGTITATCPSIQGHFICKLGIAINPTTLLLQIEEGILLA